MKFHQNIIIRTPIFPFNKILNQKLFAEALYLSSPDLKTEYDKYNNGYLNDKKSIDRLNISIDKYQTRSFTRCTPFGLFAGVEVVKWGEESKVLYNLNEKSHLSRKTRLDMNIVCSIAYELSKIPFIKNNLKFYPNNSIYYSGNFLRYVEYYYTDNQRFHKISKVDFSEYLESILNAARNGTTLLDLSLLLQKEEIPKEVADTFINEVAESQLLTSELEPNLTGIEFFDNILSIIKQVSLRSEERNEINQILELLNSIKSEVIALDIELINQNSLYLSILKKIRIIVPKAEEKNIVQCDLYKKTEHNTLEYGIQKKIFSSIKFLDKITPFYNNNNLDEFKKRFTERYDGKLMPLLNVLDSENGIGYPNKDVNGINELIDDLHISNAIPNQTIKWNNLQDVLSKILNYATSNNLYEIELEDKDFEELNYESNDLPFSMSVIFKILDKDCKKIHLQGISDISACNILGRFTNGSNEIFQTVKEIADHEQIMAGNKILAEIVHAPERRIGNVLIRKVFRDYEIPYLAKSNLNINNQILLEDLYIKIENNIIILYSKRLNAEIIPRLGTSHNFSYNSLPIYHFLADLQIQYFKKPYIGFSWGVISTTFRFLPRATYKGIVLKPATWHLSRKDFEHLLNSKDNTIELFHDFMNKSNLPKKFIIIDGDNELLINTENQISIKVFLDCLKNRHRVVIEEFMFEEEFLIKDTNGDGYTNECIAIILNDTNKLKNTKNISNSLINENRDFILGSEWLYYKIYCGVKTADYILTEKIKQITEILLNKEIIDKWFFIRYSDPDIHLRVRFHIIDFQKYTELLQLLKDELEPFVNQNVISKIQTDTYKQELGRYGNNSIELVEQLFYYDSVFVTNMLDILDADKGNSIRWKIAIRSVDEFLNNFRLTLEEKYNLIEELCTSFFNEHGGEKELKVMLDAKFRILRSQIEEIMDISGRQEKDYYPIIELINKRSERNEPIVTKLLSLASNQQLQLTLNDLLASLLHMNLDRLFMGRNRTNEFVVYDLLFRYYKSSLARIKSITKKDIITS